MSNEFKDWINDFSEEQMKNYELCIKYPILVPRNNLTGDELSDYNYNYTMLDLIPDGWRIAFGEEWANEVQCAINKLPENKRDNIFIVQLKEKYGIFFQYFSNYTDDLETVIRKYENLSEKICIECGKPATKVSTNWISPYCDECAKNIRHEIFRDIKESVGDNFGNN